MNLNLLDVNQLYILLKVALAMLLGALIGLDREAAKKPAGLRTNMLVAGAAALLVAIGEVLLRDFDTEIGANLVRSDPIRIVEAVITGISFLGAGTIIRHREGGEVEGLTTAASLLFTAAVGVGVALSQWTLVIGVTLLVLIILRLLPITSRWLQRHLPPPEAEERS